MKSVKSHWLKSQSVQDWIVKHSWLKLKLNETEGKENEIEIMVQDKNKDFVLLQTVVTKSVSGLKMTFW